MTRRVFYLSIGVVVIILAVVGVVVDRDRQQPAQNTAKSQASTPTTAANQTPDQKTPAPAGTASAPVETASPLGDPKTRVTKKGFGLYVTPQNSPVQPEKFTGYHTGWDFETTAAEASTDVPVSAFCAGTLKLKEWASGYGGVAVEACSLNGQAVTVIYGHLNIDSVTAAVGSQLGVGDKIGLLGMGFSHQTDGERKHLHFDIHKGTSINIKGYVQNQADLSGWADPATYLGSL